VIPAPELIQIHSDVHGTDPTLLSTAPGRINLLGEHVDYLGGRVLPAAIDRGITVVGRPSGDGVLRVHSVAFDERIEWDEGILSCAAPGSWRTYLWGVLRELAARGVPWTGATLVVAGDVPLGAGLSSSAALEVALLGWLTRAAGQAIVGADLARLARKVENDQVGTACGIMDQFVSVHGRAGHVLNLDCETLDYRLFRADLNEHCWVLVNSMVQHDLADQYNQIRFELESAETKLAAGPLLQVPEERIAAARGLTGSERARARYVTAEARRTRAFVAAAEAGDVQTVGELLVQTHHGLGGQMKVSTPELDAIVEIGAAFGGWIGGRMIGGGFGGCVLNLVREDAEAAFTEHVRAAFRDRFGLDCEVYPVTLADGWRVVGI